MGYSVERFKNQAYAELAVIEALGLESLTGRTWVQLLEEEWLDSNGIHVLLHVDQGIPKDGCTGDLLVMCDVQCLDPVTVRLLGVQVVGDGNLQPFHQQPDDKRLPEAVAEYLVKRSAHQGANS